MDSIAILSGFAVGAIVGMTGVGGGSLMTPLLIGVFKLHPALAIGTDLWFAALTKTGGAVAHTRHGHVDWGITKLLLAGSLPAAVGMIALMHATGITKNWASALTLSLGIALLLTAVVVAYRQAWTAVGLKLERWLPEQHKPALTVASGAILGALVTLSSIGAGALGATLILLLYPHMKPAEVAGTDIAYAVPLTAIAAVGHWWLGSIDWMLLLTLLVGSLPGITVGSYFAKSVPERMLRGLLAFILVAVAAKLIF